MGYHSRYIAEMNKVVSNREEYKRYFRRGVQINQSRLTFIIRCENSLF